MKHPYFLVFLTPLLVFLLLELAILRIDLFWWALLGSLLIILMTVVIFASIGKAKKKWWNFFILPCVFVSSLTLYSSLLTNKIIINFLFLIVAFFIFNYLRSSYFLLIRPEKYQESFLENISAYGNFLIFFFAASSIYALRSLLAISLWPLALSLLGLSILIIYQMTWINKITFKEGGIYIFLISLLVLEIGAGIYFLPFNYNALGLILAICYYMLIGLTRILLRKSLNARSVKLYLFFGFLSIILILFTAKWA